MVRSPGVPGEARSAQQPLFGRRPPARRSAGSAADGGPAAAAGVLAEVCVLVAQPHLDHLFSYRVPPAMASEVRVGVKVKVPFANSSVDGWVLAVGPGDTSGLRDVRRVVSPLPVLTEAVAVVARAVADHYAGTLADVLRTAVPPRHARGERAAALSSPVTVGPVGPLAPGPSRLDDQDGWGQVVGGRAFCARLLAGQSPRAAVRLPLGADPWTTLAVAAAHTVRSGRRALLVVPDVSDVVRLTAACVAELGEPDRVAALHHGLGAEVRWRTYCRALAGAHDIVIGTRAAGFAPVPGLGLVALWDDGDDAHAEPHAPGWHSLVVARLRAEQAGAALAVLSHSRSVQVQALVVQGRLDNLAPDRATRRRTAPRVQVPDSADPLEAAARLPRAAHRVIADGLELGPVLVSVPRRGYVPAVACGRCRAPAVCRRCPGRLVLVTAAAPGALRCGWCATVHDPWSCATCGGVTLRAGVVGVRRSAEEFGRAFARQLAGAPVVTSHGGQRVLDVPAQPQLVLATPGAEPVAAGRYSAAVLLDADATLARSGLQVVEESVRRWLHVGSLVRPAAEGGRLLVIGDGSAAAVQALVRDAPEELAARLLAERTAAGLPPVGTIAELVGDCDVVDALAAALRGDDVLALDAGAVAHEEVTVLGPVPVPGGARLLLAGARGPVTVAVREVLARRSARHGPGRLRVRVDPIDLD